MLSNPILVSDEQIKEGDFYFKYDRILQWVKETSVTYTRVHPSNYPKPIVAGIEGLPKLDLSLIAKGIGWVDVEKLAYKAAQKRFKLEHIPLLQIDEYGGEIKEFVDVYIDTYKAAQSLNEKKYSEEDMRNILEEGISWWTNNKDTDLSDSEDFLKRYIQSLSKPKEYLVEVQRERTRYPKGDDGWEDVYTPKIINNTITVTKILK